MQVLGDTASMASRTLPGLIWRHFTPPAMPPLSRAQPPMEVLSPPFCKTPRVRLRAVGFAPAKRNVETVVYSLLRQHRGLRCSLTVLQPAGVGATGAGGPLAWFLGSLPNPSVQRQQSAITSERPEFRSDTAGSLRHLEIIGAGRDR
jgi:hypothetical protein